MDPETRRRDECFQIGDATTPEEVMQNHMREASTPGADARTLAPDTVRDIVADAVTAALDAIQEGLSAHDADRNGNEEGERAIRAALADDRPTDECSNTEWLEKNTPQVMGRPAEPRVPQCADCDEPGKCQIMGCGWAAVVKAGKWTLDELLPSDGSRTWAAPPASLGAERDLRKRMEAIHHAAETIASGTGTHSTVACISRDAEWCLDALARLTRTAPPAENPRARWNREQHEINIASPSLEKLAAKLESLLNDPMTSALEAAGAIAAMFPARTAPLEVEPVAWRFRDSPAERFTGEWSAWMFSPMKPAIPTYGPVRQIEPLYAATPATAAPAPESVMPEDMTPEARLARAESLGRANNRNVPRELR